MYPFPNAENISMPRFHLLHVAGTGQSTTPRWLLWMSSFENYADQSWDRRQELIGMRLGTRFFTYGMNTSQILLHMHTLIHGPTSHAKTNLARHVAALPARRWVQCLLSWHAFGTRRLGRPRHIWESKLHAYCRYANLGSWREVDDAVWNSHLVSFVSFCRM